MFILFLIPSRDVNYSQCSIHQPSAELFQVFDRMLLLRKGGQTCYFGDIGRNATTLIDYFERNGARKCLPNENP
jgi:ATP-binding cassette subfamily G (WHITE) protein 2 (SNQ2)